MKPQQKHQSQNENKVSVSTNKIHNRHKRTFNSQENIMHSLITIIIITIINNRKLHDVL